jgi:hypothetical protein
MLFINRSVDTSAEFLKQKYNSYSLKVKEFFLNGYKTIMFNPTEKTST